MSKTPSTPAIRLLREQGVPFTEHPYRYEDRGGTRVSARELGVEELAGVKTLVMEDEDGAPLLVLQHGDREVSTKALARALGKKPKPPSRAAQAFEKELEALGEYGPRHFQPRGGPAQRPREVNERSRPGRL